MTIIEFISSHDIHRKWQVIAAELDTHGVHDPPFSFPIAYLRNAMTGRCLQKESQGMQGS